MWEGGQSLAVEWAGDLSLCVTSGWFLFHRLSFFLCEMGIRSPPHSCAVAQEVLSAGP